MNELTFKTYAVAKEIDLNKIARECGIKKKYIWEEPLILQERLLEKIIGECPGEDEKILLFSFGSVVFINSTREHNEIFMQFLKDIKIDIDLKNYTEFQEDYALHLASGKEVVFTDDYVRIPKLESFYPLLTSIVIAKSAALKRTEEQLSIILDELESKIDNLEMGKLNIGNRELARIISKIVRHEYNTIAYIMILDKPGITWTNTDAADFYEKMSYFFELNDRYEVIKSKTEILKGIIDGLSTITNAMRGLFVEWVIVILIVVEVILMLLFEFA
ncbi:hypothetical protein SPSYN_00157 [Sporotomaculum syntrophicum]|uniref:DUF155 domain-containing protein n=1 Tax=Sporotomaculum syntrophicum TaxID=182264 RepID=A0A9D2WS49_9FIRM|nr:RMD1 family protein [Sporotomaculum syntrophicum]KAF1086439.1 hypothetical protein SPSYN_00157 [Sporotomaculum syntrophicum]